MTTIQELRARFPDANNWEDRGDGLYRCTRTFIRGYMYYLVGDGWYAGAPAHEFVDQKPGMEAEVRRLLEREAEYQQLPTCIVPGCEEKAPYVFKAAERGYLAGQRWEPGDEIRTCPEHGVDIYRAQGVRGRDQLAEWLRPDAKLDALDEFDAGTDLLHGHAIRESRARMLWVTIPANGQATT